jgi:hypothetical protein
VYDISGRVQRGGRGVVARRTILGTAAAAGLAVTVAGCSVPTTGRTATGAVEDAP